MLSASAVEQRGAILFVRGTGEDDSVIVEQFVANGSITASVGSTGGTFTGVKLVIVDTGAGDDTVVVDTVSANALIRTGDGADVIEVNAFGTANIVVDSGADGDFIFLTAANGAKITGFSDGGKDDISLTTGDGGTIIFNAGSGDDFAVIIEAGGTIVYSGGSGFDSVALLEGEALIVGVEDLQDSTS